MRWREHMPLAVATAVIVATIAICTAILVRALREQPPPVDSSYELRSIDQHLETIDKSLCEMNQREGIRAGEQWHVGEHC